MSVPKEFYKPNVKMKRYEEDYTASGGSGSVSNGGLIRKISVKDAAALPLSLTPERLYYAGGRLLAYLSDNKLYIEENGAFTKYSDNSYAAPPDVVAITVNGESKIAVVTEEGAVFSDGQTADIVKGERYAAINGMFFSAEGRTLYFSAPFDQENFSVNSGGGGQFASMPEDGEITALADAGEYLAVLCKRRAIRLDFAGAQTDYRAERLASPADINVVKNTAAAVGDRIIFISGGFLCEFYKSSVSAVKALPFQDYTVTAAACSFGEAYLLPVTVGDEAYTYCYDALTGSEHLLPAYAAYSETGGFVYDFASGKVLGLSFSYAESGEQTSGANIAAVSERGAVYDFGSCFKKRLYKAEVHCTGAAVLTVSGESADKTFALKEGCNALRINMTSREFTVRITGFSAGFELKKAAFEYAVLGG